MNSEEIKSIIDAAVRTLYKNQPNLYAFTSETKQTEWNLGNHLAYELRINKFLAGFDCDIDVIKRNFDNRRPDIIFHKRGVNEFNFLVIELKYNKGKDEIQEDIDKIKTNWFRSPLLYYFGAVVNLGAAINTVPEIYVIKNAQGRNITKGYKTQ